jgi:7-keto-8-aminopelargonate synthetase-like enzyme
MIAAAIGAAIGVMREEPHRQRRVRELAGRVRESLGMSGESPIVPVIVGQASRAVEAGETLREAGMLVLAVRPPTVPKGTSRLRVTLSSEHSDEEVDRLIRSVRDLTAA